MITMTLREYFKLIKCSSENKSNKMSNMTQKIKSMARDNQDEFYDFIKDEPEFESKEFGTFIAGLIQLICNDLNIKAPNWIFNKSYYLEKPYSRLLGYDRVPKSLINCTSIYFKSRNYYTNEKGVLV